MQIDIIGKMSFWDKKAGQTRLYLTGPAVPGTTDGNLGYVLYDGNGNPSIKTLNTKYNDISSGLLTLFESLTLAQMRAFADEVADDKYRVINPDTMRAQLNPKTAAFSVDEGRFISVSQILLTALGVRKQAIAEEKLEAMRNMLSNSRGSLASNHRLREEALNTYTM